MRRINVLSNVLLNAPRWILKLPARYGYNALFLTLTCLLLAAVRASGMHVVWLRRAALDVLAFLGTGTDGEVGIEAPTCWLF